MTIHSFKLFADYFQFYLQDEKATGDLSDAWTPEAVDRLLALAPGVVGVGTARNMDVPVDVEVLDSERSLTALCGRATTTTALSSGRRDEHARIAWHRVFT